MFRELPSKITSGVSPGDPGIVLGVLYIKIPPGVYPGMMLSRISSEIAHRARSVDLDFFKEFHP